MLDYVCVCVKDPAKMDSNQLSRANTPSNEITVLFLSAEIEKELIELTSLRALHRLDSKAGKISFFCDMGPEWRSW